MIKPSLRRTKEQLNKANALLNWSIQLIHDQPEMTEEEFYRWFRKEWNLKDPTVELVFTLFQGGKEWKPERKVQEVKGLFRLMGVCFGFADFPMKGGNSA